MLRLFVLLGFTAMLFLPACAMWDRDRDERQAAVTSGQQAEPQAGIAEQRVQTQESAEFMGVAPKTSDTETIVLEAKNGNVNFTHAKHAKTIDCGTCHKGTPGKIPDFGKDQAHALCITCHKEKNAGPTKCNECHKKS